MAKASGVAKALASPMPAGPGVIDLAVGHPAPSNLPHVQLAAACRRAAERLTQTAAACSIETKVSVSPAQTSANHFPLGYADNAGTPGYIQTLTGWLTKMYGSGVHPQSLVTTNGVSHGLDLACGALSKPGDLVLLEQPCYFLAKHIFTGRHLRAAAAPTDAHGIDTTVLAEQLKSGAEVPTLVYVIPSHSNPAGTTLPTSRRAHLVELALEYGFTILADDVYHLLEWSPSTGERIPRMIEYDPWWRAWQESGEVALPQPAVSGGTFGDAGPTKTAAKATAGVVISIASFTKILSPALRLGWIEAAPMVAHRIAQDGVIVSGGGTAAFASEIVVDVIMSGDQDLVLRELCSEYEKGCDALCGALEAADCFRFHRPCGGYFVWVELPDGVTATQLKPLALKRGVSFLPGDRCAIDETSTFDRNLRLCFAYEPLPRLRRGVELLAEAVAEARSATKLQ